MDRKSTLTLVACAAAAIAGSFAWGQEKQGLPYHRSADPHPLVRAFPAKTLGLVSEPPKNVPLPDFKSEKPLFAKWPSRVAPTGFLWIALDRTASDGPYDRLFIDSNGNGRLTDEKLVFAGFETSFSASFGPVKVTLGTRREPFQCELNFAFTQRDGSPRLSVRSAGWRQGTIAVGGKEWNCLLIDQNANGAFDDRSIDFKNCDLIQIDEKGTRDICLVGNFIEVGGKLYRLQVGRDGSHVILAEAKDAEFGAIKQQKEMTELVAGGENGMLTLKLKKGVGKLPVGEYRVYQWVIERKDKQDGTWSLQATSFGNPDVFEISRGKKTSLALGESITSCLDVRQRGRDYVINHSWRGQSGEQVRLIRNGVSPPPAKVHIRNADGSYDRTFTFDHG